MYDKQGFKKAFIKEIEDSGVNKNFGYAAGNYFNTVQPVEELKEKDLCNFSVPQIIDMYKYICTASVETLMMMNSVFSRYGYYCRDNGYITDGINHYEEMTKQMLFECVNQVLAEDKIISRTQLMKDIKNSAIFLNPCDKFLVLALFEGIAGKQYCNLIDMKADQFKDGKVTLKSGVALAVSKELSDLAYESAKEYFYYSDNINAKTDKWAFKDEPYILKNLYNVKKDDSAERKRVNFNNKLLRIQSRAGSKAYSYGHLIESGRIDMIKNGMADNNMDTREYLRTYAASIKERFGEIQAPGRYILKYGDYLK